MEAQWGPFFRMLLLGCCPGVVTTANTDIFSPGAGTNNSLRERRHEHLVRLDEEELPTAAFIFMKVTILEELRVFGIVAVAPLVEHVDAWTLGPLPTKQTLVPYSSDVYCSRFEEPRVRRVFVLWRAFAFIARTRLCAIVEACLCQEAVMITVRLQCLVLRRYGVEDANWSHPIFPPVTTATILAARNLFPPPRPRGVCQSQALVLRKAPGSSHGLINATKVTVPEALLGIREA